MHDPNPTRPSDPASSASAYPPERAAEIRRQLEALALALFSWTARAEPDQTSTASERMMGRVFRPWLPKLRDALLSRLSSADPAALEAVIGASASALESIIYYAPGAPLPRYLWRWREGPDGQRLELVARDDGDR